MRTKEQFDLYKGKISVKIETIYESIHRLILKNNQIKISIYKLIDEHDNIDFKIRMIRTLDGRDTQYCYKVIHTYNVDSKERLIINTVITSVSINNQIKQYVTDINYYTFLYNIPYEIFYKFIVNYANVLMNNVLSGESINIPRLGKIYIKKIKCNHNKTFINWEKSNQVKKELITKGEEVYDSETGDGVKWIVQHNDDYFYYFCWIRDRKTKELYNYKFHPTNFSNTLDRSKRNYYNNVTKLDDIFNDSKIGNVQKMMAILHKVGHIKQLFDERYELFDKRKNHNRELNRPI